MVSKMSGGEGTLGCEEESMQTAGKMGTQMDMLHLLVQPQEEIQLTSKQITPRTARKSKCVEV